MYYLAVVVLFIWCGAINLSAQNYFDRGKQLFESGQYNDALESFQKEAAEQSSRRKIINFYYIGRTYEQLNEKTKALEVYNKIIKEYPDNFLAESSLNRIKAIEPSAKIDYSKITEKSPSKSSVPTQPRNVVSTPTSTPSANRKNSQTELLKKDYSYSDALTERKSAVSKNVKQIIKEDSRKNTAHTQEINLIANAEAATLNLPITQNQSEAKNNLKSLQTATFNNINTASAINETPAVYAMQPIMPVQPIKITVIESVNTEPVDFMPQAVAPVIDQELQAASELEKLFEAAGEKMRKNLFIDSLLDYKEYISKAPESLKKEIAYYKLGEINHLLGYFNEASTAYLEYLKKYENSVNAYRACYNLANIYSEALGMQIPAKQYYLLALDKTNNIEMIDRIKDKLIYLEKKYASVLNEQKKNTPAESRDIKLSEKIGSEKGVILSDADNMVQNTSSQRPVNRAGSVFESQPKPLINRDLPANMRMIVPEFKQIEPLAQKGRTRAVGELIEPKKEVEYYIVEGYKAKNLGMYGEAIKQYKTAIEHYPDHPIAYNNLAYLYSELSVNLDEALSLVETAIRLDTLNRGSYLDTLGWIYFKMNDYTKARDVLEKAVFYNPSAIRKYHLAQVYKKLNLFDKALIELQGAQVIQPTGKLAETIRNEIYELQQN